MRRIEWYTHASGCENAQELRGWLMLAERWAGYMEQLLRGGAEVAAIAEEARSRIVRQDHSAPAIQDASYNHMAMYLYECWAQHGPALMAWYAAQRQSW